nr:MAG TPA: hypothetical protein [Caudoviricetes sp.]
MVNVIKLLHSCKQKCNHFMIFFQKPLTVCNVFITLRSCN